MPSADVLLQIMEWVSFAFIAFLAAGAFYGYYTALKDPKRMESAKLYRRGSILLGLSLLFFIVRHISAIKHLPFSWVLSIVFGVLLLTGLKYTFKGGELEPDYKPKPIKEYKASRITAFCSSLVFFISMLVGATFALACISYSYWGTNIERLSRESIALITGVVFGIIALSLLRAGWKIIKSDGQWQGPFSPPTTVIIKYAGWWLLIGAGIKLWDRNMLGIASFLAGVILLFASRHIRTPAENK